MNDDALKLHRVRFTSVAALPMLCTCSSGGRNDPAAIPLVPPVVEPPINSAEFSSAEFTVLTERTPDADGEGIGLDACELLHDFGGPNPIEAPDLYPIGHPGVRHIFVDSDATVGNHSAFSISEVMLTEYKGPAK